MLRIEKYFFFMSDADPVAKGRLLKQEEYTTSSPQLRNLKMGSYNGVVESIKS